MARSSHGPEVVRRRRRGGHAAGVRSRRRSHSAPRLHLPACHRKRRGRPIVGFACRNLCRTADQAASIYHAIWLQRPAGPPDLSPGDVVLYKTRHDATAGPTGPRRRAVHDVYLVKSLVHASEILWVVSASGGDAAPPRRHDADRLRQGDVLPPALHAAGTAASSRRSRTTAIGSPPRSAAGRNTASAMRRRGRTARSRARSTTAWFAPPNASPGRVDRRRQPLSAEDRAEERRAADPGRRRSRHRVSDRRGDRAGDCRPRTTRPGIPMIAIDIPHPGATYFGANNYEAGLLAGRHLARWAKQHWNGQADEILLVELARAGSLPAARGRGVVAGIREVIHDAAGWPVVVDRRRRSIQDRARTGPQAPARDRKPSRMLVGAANDPSALGAARAFQESRAQRLLRHRRAERRAGRPSGAAASRARRSSRRSATFPEKYGDGLIRLALEILGRRPVAAGDVRQAPDRHARERRPPLSERCVDGCPDVRPLLAEGLRPWTPLHALSRAASPARSVRVARCEARSHLGRASGYEIASRATANTDHRDTRHAEDAVYPCDGARVARRGRQTTSTYAPMSNEYEREPVPESAQLGFKSFLGQYAGEHTAGTELMIGPLFVAAGVSAFDLLGGPARRQPARRPELDVPDRADRDARAAHALLPARKDLRPAARHHLQPRQRPDVLLARRRR